MYLCVQQLCQAAGGQKVTHVYGSGRVILPFDLEWSEATVTPIDPFIASL